VDVSEIGEFGLIERLSKLLQAGSPPEELITGIGDDAAVWRAGDQYLIATTDSLVAGVHFLPAFARRRDVGWKALAVNVSDIAAMGGDPLFALVTLAVPPQEDAENLDELYRGLDECAREYGVAVIGGDVVSAPVAAVTIALVGRARGQDGNPGLLLRSGARVGDVLAVTGTLGDSAAGLLRMKAGAPADDPLVKSHMRPRPPLEAGKEAAAIGISCAIDISDGLLQDAGHVCRMSSVAAEIDAASLPISEAVRGAFGEQALQLACGGGEDYQLLFAGPRTLMGELGARCPVPLTVIGRITDGPSRVRVLDSAGQELRFQAAGWDHLRAAQPPR
jgi:thiamine-monophosphate kinase